MKRLSVSIFLLLAFTFMGLAPGLRANDMSPNSLKTYIITASIICADEGGTISPSGATSVAEDSSLSIVITPNDNYRVRFIEVGIPGSGSQTIVDFANDSRCEWDSTTGEVIFTFSDVAGNYTLSVCFITKASVLPRVTATVAGGTGGTISSTMGTEVVGSPTIREFTVGEDPFYTITPNSGWKITEVVVDGAVVDLTNDPNVAPLPVADSTLPITYTFNDIATNHTIVVTFADANTYYRVDVEYHYTGEGVDDATFEGTGTAAQAIGPILPGVTDFPANATWRGTSTSVVDGYTGVYGCTFMGDLTPTTLQPLYLDSIFVDGVKYTGNITRATTAIFNPDINVTVNGANVLIQMYMSVGSFRTVKLNFIYDADMTKPTVPVIDLPDFFDITADSAEAKAEYGVAFDLNYTLHDVNPPNDTVDNRIDSIYLNGTKWTGTIPAPSVDAVNLAGLIASVDADATITLYINRNDPAVNIPELTIPSLSINPNPVDSKAFITKDANVIFTKIDIIDIMGNVVMTINNPSESLDIDRLNAGSYIVRFFTKDGFTTRNIIKR